jgi:BirA family transcriptional regulator, biotin operon repressor / biotin---[acetyl-CoA-carboxylase] ligase
LPVSSINNRIGNPLIEIASTPSTNNYAMELVHKGLAQHGLAMFAYEQTAGKGQRGREWHSSREENIILSVMLNASGLQVSSPFLLSMTTALAAHDLFSTYAGDESSVKWPNDLYWRDRKAGGILIENVIAGRDWQWAVAGIGININQTSFTPKVTNAVSLRQITGKTFKPVELAKELCACLDERFRQLLNKSSQTIVEAYNNILYKKGQKVALKKNSAVFDCTVKGVNAYGQLITEATTEQLFEVGEVQWII